MQHEAVNSIYRGSSGMGGRPPDPRNRCKPDKPLRKCSTSTSINCARTLLARGEKEQTLPPLTIP